MQEERERVYKEIVITIKYQHHKDAINAGGLEELEVKPFLEKLSCCPVTIEDITGMGCDDTDEYKIIYSIDAKDDFAENQVPGGFYDDSPVSGD